MLETDILTAGSQLFLSTFRTQRRQKLRPINQKGSVQDQLIMKSWRKPCLPGLSLQPSIISRTQREKMYNLKLFSIGHFNIKLQTSNKNKSCEILNSWKPLVYFKLPQDFYS